MDRWKFVNEKWIPRPVSRVKGYVLGIAAFSFRSLPHYYENLSRVKNGAKSTPFMFVSAAATAAFWGLTWVSAL